MRLEMIWSCCGAYKPSRMEMSVKLIKCGYTTMFWKILLILRRKLRVLPRFRSSDTVHQFLCTGVRCTKRKGMEKLRVQ